MGCSRESRSKVICTNLWEISGTIWSNFVINTFLHTLEYGNCRFKWTQKILLENFKASDWTDWEISLWFSVQKELVDLPRALKDDTSGFITCEHMLKIGWGRSIDG